MDKGVTLQYLYHHLFDGDNGDWQIIQDYAPSNDTCFEDEITIAAGDFCATPLQTTELSKPEFYQEFVSVNNSRLDIRWVQHHDKHAVKWLIDNITLRYWDGECSTILLHQDFEEMTPHIINGVGIRCKVSYAITVAVSIIIM